MGILLQPKGRPPRTFLQKFYEGALLLLSTVRNCAWWLMNAVGVIKGGTRMRFCLLPQAFSTPKLCSSHCRNARRYPWYSSCRAQAQVPTLPVDPLPHCLAQVLEGCMYLCRNAPARFGGHDKYSELHGQCPQCEIQEAMKMCVRVRQAKQSIGSLSVSSSSSTGGGNMDIRGWSQFRA